MSDDGQVDDATRSERPRRTAAARHILDELAHLALSRSSGGSSLEEACEELGIDPETVRARASDITADKHEAGQPVVTLDEDGNVVRRWADGTEQRVENDDG